MIHKPPGWQVHKIAQPKSQWGKVADSRGFRRFALATLPLSGFFLFALTEGLDATCKCMCDHAGWCSTAGLVEVDESGDASGKPLSQYVQQLPNHRNLPIHHDESHQRGFLHRLDVPSSGMILVASTYSAYYDLQFQLSSGILIRDYAVLSHGWWSADRGVIRASVTWAETGAQKDSPSRITPGKNSETNLKVLSHSVRMGSTLSLLAIRIGTGRKHQIRVHTAHAGHATVSDGGVDELRSLRST